MLNTTKRIAVLGLYNSGSTVLAGMLHRMGVNMGAPFWSNSQEGHPENFYESMQVSRHVRSWWIEPLARERVASPERIRFLQSWAMIQEFERPGPLGVKHPMLSLCGPDLVAAWGSGICFVRAARSLDESINGLKRRGWFCGYEAQLQKRLWDALEAFERSHPSTVTLDWNLTKSDPARAARELAAAAGMDPTESQFAAAVALVRSPLANAA